MLLVAINAAAAGVHITLLKLSIPTTLMLLAIPYYRFAGVFFALSFISLVASLAWPIAAELLHLFQPR